MERETFIFHGKWYEAIKDLDPTTKASALDSICNLALYGKTIESDNLMIRMAMSFITPELEADCERWIKTKEARSEAGKKGNEKRWGSQRESQSIANDSKTSQCDNSESQSIANIADNVIPMLNVNVNDSFLNTHACAGEGWMEDKDFVLEIGRKFLKKGILHPCEEARSFIRYNDMNGWKNSKGSTIRDKKGWADKWKTKSEKVRVVAKYADGYIYLLEACGILDDTHMDALQAFVERDGEIEIRLSDDSMRNEILECFNGDKKSLIHDIQDLFFESKDFLFQTV